MTEANDWNRQIIEEFRANQGQVGGQFAGAPLLLLTTTGARSGQPRTSPMMYLDADGRRYVFASKAGAPTNPDWYHNLKANPTVTVEVGTDELRATARGSPAPSGTGSSPTRPTCTPVSPSTRRRRTAPSRSSSSYRSTDGHAGPTRRRRGRPTPRARPTVNFLAHVVVAHRVEGDSPAVALGAALPDLVTIAGCRFDNDRLTPDLRRGVACHHQADRGFHADRRFLTGAAAIRSAAAAGGLAPGPSRAVGHVGEQSCSTAPCSTNRRWSMAS